MPSSTAGEYYFPGFQAVQLQVIFFCPTLNVVLFYRLMTGDEPFTLINIDDFKRPWSAKIEGFFAVLLCDTHFKSELQRRGYWLRINQNNLRTQFFLSLKVDFSSPSPDPLRPRRPAQAGINNGVFARSSKRPANFQQMYSEYTR